MQSQKKHKKTEHKEDGHKTSLTGLTVN